MEGELLQQISLPMTHAPATEQGEVVAPTAQWARGLRALFGYLLPSGAYHLRGIAISGHGPTIIPLYNDGSFADQAIMWMDESATESSRRIVEKTGVSLPPRFWLPKILNIQSTTPEKFEKISSFLGTSEFLSYLLTGELCTVLPSKGWQSHYWNSKMLHQLSLDTQLFPPFVMPGDVIGEVSVSQAFEYGVPQGVPVVAGGPDFMMAIIGSGVVKSGVACNRSGSSEGVNLCTSQRPANLVPPLFCTEHVIPQSYVLSGTIDSSGLVLESLWRKFGENQSFTQFLDWALLDQPTSASSQQKARKGIEEVLLKLRGVVFAISKKEDFSTLRVSGGVNNPNLHQLKANMTGKVVETLMIHSAELMGDFIMLQKGIGEVVSIQEGVENLVKISHTYTPQL